MERAARKIKFVQNVTHHLRWQQLNYIVFGLRFNDIEHIAGPDRFEASPDHPHRRDSLPLSPLLEELLLAYRPEAAH